MQYLPLNSHTENTCNHSSIWLLAMTCQCFSYLINSCSVEYTHIATQTNVSQQLTKDNLGVDKEGDSWQVSRCLYVDDAGSVCHPYSNI